MTEEKRLNKQHKKQKRKFLSPWRALTIWGMILAVGFGFGSVLASMADNALGVFVNGKTYELVDEDPNAVYYASDFDSEAEMLAYGKQVSLQVEAEGAVLLKNENHTLPLAAGSKVSCFSTSSVNLVYCGTGAAAIDTASADTLKEALEAAGFSVNETLWNFYENGEASQYHRRESGYIPVKSTLHEAPWEVYTDEVLASVEEYSDAAIVVLARMGGEHWDLEHETSNFLALDETEREMLENVCRLKEEGKVSRVIVLLNSSNAMEMDFLNDYTIDACLQIGSVGQYGISAVAQILAGTVNPSGSLVDTWCYDNFTTPSMWNFQPVNYEGAAEADVPGNADSYVVYQEGIYVGYRYYETRYEDYVMGTGNAGEYDYHSLVAFPFGYGLSYTEFAYSDMQVEYDPAQDAFLVRVQVTNTGDMAGKETVQIYAQSPYTEYDRINGVEKSSVVLCGYGKTQLLQPGEAVTLEITVRKSDIASYDANGAGTYILDAGDYYLTAAADAHTAVNQILAAKHYTVSNTEGRMTEDADASLTWSWTEDRLDKTTYAFSANGTAVSNRFSDADPNQYEGITETVTWLSRSDWTGTFPTEAVKLTMTELLAQDLQHNQYDSEAYDSAAYEMPIMGADNGLSLYQMIGKEMDDPDWELLLDQLTFDDMVALISDAFHSRPAVESVQAPSARDENGPTGLNTSFLDYEAVATAFPTGDVMAATFNNALVYEVGYVIANNCLMADVSCLYGPGANLHRTAYGGRNFEYYSEDAFLTGQMCAAETKGLEDMGIDTILKHFALNESEADRIGLGVWINEQAARELYLKAFQASFEESGANGVMAAYTRWGATWSGGNEALISGVLREEWGCDGWLISDNVRTNMITAADGLLAGLTTFDAPLPAILNFEQYRDDPLIVTKMREACHYNLYALANSPAMNGIGEDTTVEVVEYFMIPLFRWLSIGSFLLAIFAACMWRRRVTKMVCH